MSNLTIFIAIFTTACVLCIKPYERAVCSGVKPLIIHSHNERDELHKTLADSVPNDPLVRSSDNLRGIELMTDGELNFPLVIIISGRPVFKTDHILEYLSAGGSLLWALDGTTDSNTDSLIKHLGMKAVGKITDEMNFREGLISSSNFRPDHSLYPQLKGEKVPYSGAGLSIATQEDGKRYNDLIRPLLVAEESAQTESVVGDQIVLIATLNSRNGGRIMVSGSTSIFGRPSNMAVQTTIISWLMGNISNIQLESFDHHQGSTVNSAYYIVKTRFGVKACLTETRNSVKQPFLPTDLQVELTRQYPFERITLRPISSDRCLYGEMEVPDVYGHYTLKLDYTRPGLPIVRQERKIIVRPEWLDKIPRFNVASVPYYVGWQLQLLSTCLLLIPFLWLELGKQRAKEE